MYGNETSCGDRQDEESSRARVYLQTFLQENTGALQRIMCGYVSKMGLATGERIEAVAAEIFQDAVIETLAHAERFRLEMQPRPWFLAIAANMLKRHRASYAKCARFEVLIGSLANTSRRESEQDVLDLLVPSEAVGPEQMLERREGVRELLALVSQDDAHLLTMALLEGWSAEALGSLMGITPGTARVRVHRALHRLREAWRTSEQGKEWSRHHLLILYWNGKVWQQIPAPALQETYNLPNSFASGIAVYGERQVWIVGDERDSEGGYGSALILGQRTCP